MEELYSAVLSQGAIAMTRLFSLLLQWKDTMKELDAELLQKSVEILPDSLQIIFSAYSGARTSKDAIDFDSYMALLPEVIGKNTDGQLYKYIQLAVSFSTKQMRIVADSLFNAEKWDLAWGVYENICESQAKLSGDFWRSYGICLYYRQDKKNALLAFAQARELGCQTRDIAAYQKWCKEGKMND